MFAVTGWNVSADKLKTQTEQPKSEKRKAKKTRQREGQSGDGPQVKALNKALPRSSNQNGTVKANPEKSRTPKRKFDDVPYQGLPKPSNENPNKKLKLERPDREKDVHRSSVGESGNVQTKQFKQPKASKEEKKHSKPVESAPAKDDANAMSNSHIPEEDAAVAPAPTLKLTPLQSAMRAKLMGSRFRYLNESLYTKPSAESLDMFKENPNFFDEYHAGFRQQVSSWPENPVDSFFSEFERRGRTGDTGAGIRPLPRTAGRCRVADLGCGDASLAKKVKSISKACRIQVDSYDLHSSEPSVIKADIASLPTESDSVNVALLCLALMGTNWIDFIEEAWRILHWKGELWIAEIKSRFSRTQRRPPDHSVGKKRKPNKAEQKQQKQLSEQKEAEQTIAEMDSNAQTTEKTDVSGFVSVLEKRGFGLADENAVDLGNKMFVRLKFVKNRPPLKGKLAGQGAKKKNWREMLREGEEDGIDEAAMLQPCLYKLR
ncbi:MAG: hypothetical protein Q9162_000105 [Coniocarpon cinnabarinum]